MANNDEGAHPQLDQNNLLYVIQLRNQMAKTLNDLTAYINAEEDALANPPQCVLMIPEGEDHHGYVGTALFSMQGSFDVLRHCINIQNMIAGGGLSNDSTE